VSTEFVQKPQKGFTHYAASKSAQEAMIRGLSLENRKYRYVLARLPRIRTDQTNIPYDPRPAAAAGSVAASLLELITRERQPVVVNLMEVDLT
jgi:NAD(P)-dependent dehydrogenase (short-subunit alcohol dehydrogenase family)